MSKSETADGDGLTGCADDNSPLGVAIGQMMTLSNQISPSRQQVIEWFQERFENTLRIAAEKTDREDREGWLLDAEYYSAALKLIRGSAS